MNLDKLTNYAFLGVNVLLTKYENRTSLGAVFGVVLISGAYVFKINIEAYTGIELTFIAFLGIFLIGVMIFHIPTIINSFKGKAIDEEYEAALKIIDSTPEFTETERREMKRKLVYKKIDSIPAHKLKEKQAEVEEAE